MDQLAGCLVDWAKSLDGSHPVDPSLALPSAFAANVFQRSSTALDAYHLKNQQQALDILESTVLALEAVAGGGDNCASWKDELSDIATFQDIAEAAQVLMRNANNLTKPFQELKKARTS